MAGSLLLIILAGIVIGAISGCGPSTYEECILKHAKEAQTHGASIQIARACRAQFPLPGHYDDIVDPFKK